MIKNVVLFLLLLINSHSVTAQLKQGFDKAEYSTLMCISAQFGDSTYAAQFHVPDSCRLLYSSSVMGMDNKWQLWLMNNQTAIISIRGTTSNAISWMENFYAAMIPASGTIHFSNKDSFAYRVAQHPKAAVHSGWMIGTAFLAKDILPKIESLYKNGIKQYLIIGHSQGGAITYLLTSQIRHAIANRQLPADIILKSYASAAPKPGNLFFAYDFESANRGWTYTVVNVLDWVPQTPFGLQTIHDFIPLNPFSDAKKFIKKQTFFKRIGWNYAYVKLTKPAKKAARQYRKFLGKYVSKSVRKELSELKTPDYYQTTDYVRTGETIVLQPNSIYFDKFPQVEGKYFVNHYHAAYLLLLSFLQ